MTFVELRDDLLRIDSNRTLRRKVVAAVGVAALVAIFVLLSGAPARAALPGDNGQAAWLELSSAERATTKHTHSSAKPKRISGKLTRPGYTVIAIAKDGRAQTRRAPHRSFNLRPPANVVTLHLRAPDGVYAGPVVLGGAKRGVRAILGVRAGARLGVIKVKPGRGYAKSLKGLRKLQRNGWVDLKRWGRAKEAVPIGAGNYGRVRSKNVRDHVAGDLDLDGIPNPLDIDDDGDKILDNLDRRPRRLRASARASADPAGDFRMRTSLGEGGDLQRTVNVNGFSHSGLIPTEYERLISANLVENLVLEMAILPGDLSELNCGLPQSRTDPTLGGLVYCTKGGTGQLSPDEEIPFGVSFPECCDANDNGFGTLVPGTSPGSGFGLSPRANSDQIGSGDLLIQHVTTDGHPVDFTSTVQYVFATNPAVASYDDGQGNSAVIKYPVPDATPGTGHNPVPVKAGPSGDVLVDLTLWRPQRRPIHPETGWIDMGGLDYGALIPSSGEFCGPGSYPSTDPNMELVDGGFQGKQRWAGFRDLSADRPANAENKFTFRLNLTKCLASKGQPFGLGETRSIGFKAVTPQFLQDDEASTALTFNRIG